MAEKIPKVLILGPITPTTDSIRGDTLEYANLQSAVDTHAPHEYRRIREFWDAEEDSLTERGAAQQLASQCHGNRRLHY